MAKPQTASAIAPTASTKQSTDGDLADPRTRGSTFISDDVVSVIARLAAEQIEGVHQIGSSSFRSLISGRNYGIESEVGMKEAAVDIDLIVEFGYPIRELARDLRGQVIGSVETMTGRRVVEVNVNVVDVHVPKTNQQHRRQLE